MIRTAAFLALMIASTPVFGANLTMVCENPRREYLVAFDEAAGTFRTDDTLYRVLAVEKTAKRVVVVGLTVDKGPTFRAHFRPYMKMEYFADNQLFQTDGCRSAK